jgi:molybdenum cofactor synthesis domain-containing protein
MPSVAVVVIGEEILSGKFADENGPFLIKRLRELGADLRRLVVTGDGVDEIADEVRRCSSSYDLVITTGGVGPTHDDRTFDGLSAAFSAPLFEHPDLLALLFGYGLPDLEATRRMARVPEGSTLLAGPGERYPVLRVKNVLVFPGVPALMRRKFESVAGLFAGEKVLTDRLTTSAPETDIAADLTEVQALEPSVNIGSYPRFGEGEPYVIITLESRDAQALARAREALSLRLPAMTR